MAVGTNSYLHRRYWPAWLTLVLGLAVSSALGWRIHRQAVELDRLRLERIAELVRDRLRARVQITDLVLRHAQDHFGAQESITDSMFREWCRKYGWSVTAPWMHGMALYTNRNAGGWRSVVPPDPTTWTEADFRRFEKFANETPIHLQFAFGYSHDPTKRWPVHYAGEFHFPTTYAGFGGAMPANTPQTTGRQIVIEHADGKLEYGATVGVPLYEVKRDELHDLVAGRPPKVTPHRYNWNLCRGMLLAPIDYVTLESSMWGDIPKEVGVDIYASPQPRPDAWLNPTGQSPHALDPAFQPYLKVLVPWTLYNGKWSLFVYSLPAFEAGSPRYLARLTVVAGVIMTTMAAALVGRGLQARHRQELLTEQIREARDALTAAQKEREKLSHDLHDNTVQTLYAIQLGLNHTSQKLEAEPARARRELSTVRAELDAVIAEIRRFITAEEGADKAVDLAGVLQAQAERARVGANARIEIGCDPDASGRLTGNQAVQLANIAREALSNSLRHARPRQVRIALRSDPDAVRLEVSDDGTGFDPKAQPPGVGLTSMTTRAREIGATLDIQSAHGLGTRVAVRVPASAPALVEPEWVNGAPDET